MECICLEGSHFAFCQALVTFSYDFFSSIAVSLNNIKFLYLIFNAESFGRMGFLIINECPSVDTENFTPALLKRHKQSLSELIRRDKNRPAVVMWSIANEPRTQLPDAGLYFKEVAYHTKSLDSTRPVTIALARGVGVSSIVIIALFAR